MEYNADKLAELITEAVCVAGEDFPHAVVSRLLKLESAHIRFVLDCLQKTRLNSGTWLWQWRETIMP